MPTVLSQLLQSVPRLEFEKLAQAHDGARRSDALPRWSQFVALAVGHLGQRHSLRDIEAALASDPKLHYHLGAQSVSRSALARANENLTADFYRDLFGELYKRLQSTHTVPGKRFRFKGKLFSLDGSMIDLSMKVFPWADINQYKAEAKKITGAFFEDLKGELGKGLKTGGPVAAIGICNTRAPALAKEHSENSGWNVARTSLKLRNPNNAPDTWETKVLQQFEEQRAKGEGPDTLIYTEIVEEGDEKYFRFMKGIVMPPLQKMPCLMCHGENLDPATAAALDQLYPQDKARGYKAGQVRGAFTLKKKL